MIQDQTLRTVKNLKWLPYIGKEYFNSDLKILFVGESHYYNEIKLNSNFDKELFTRWIVDELAIGNRTYTDKTNFFKTINKMFNDDNDVSCWNKIAFYNFVQRGMQKIVQELKDQLQKTIIKVGMYFLIYSKF